MKLLPKALVLASFAALSLTAAATSGSSTEIATHFTASPLLGSWTLDTSRMPVPPAQRPRSVRFTFADAGNNTWTTHVDIVYAPGEEVHSVGTAPLDGTLSAVENSPEADTGAVKQPAPNVLVMALRKGGVLVSTRIYSVMPDGQSLVETAVYPGNDGVPIMKTNYFTRVR
ncbi:hypothetical protein [Dyella amyloliquefaciens]|uniref:hypothetical protein n=1 Tax=Dyella amyloliquefaciens TaxID=1770545 RepID=UPI00102E524B|nr:hypothetical protein [Dyella amyloliquefaciens]